MPRRGDLLLVRENQRLFAVQLAVEYASICSFDQLLVLESQSTSSVLSVGYE